jgi:hypothetical protein
MHSFRSDILCSRHRFDFGQARLALGKRWVTHFFAIPLLSTPTTALVINDAGTCAAAAFVILHVWTSVGD